jgi:hypothetical protein
MNRFRRLTSRKDWFVLVFLRKQMIMNENKRFIDELLFFENMTIISFFARSNFFLFCTIWWNSVNKSLLWWIQINEFSDENLFAAMNIKTNCCENMLITCFASCFEMWNVIWKMRFRFVFCLKLFETIRFRDHAWSSHRQFYWSFNFAFWRMTHAHSRLSSDVCLFSICRATYVCSRLVERRLWWNVINLTKHFIKFIVSDSLNLTKAIHQIWRKKRHLIKSNERVISSNFLKRKTILLFSDEQTSAATFDVKNVILQKIFFCVINVCVKLLW